MPRCLTAKPTRECARSTIQVPAGMTVGAAAIDALLVMPARKPRASPDTTVPAAQRIGSPYRRPGGDRSDAACVQRPAVLDHSAT
jgi:hypothetical protein